MYNLGDEFKKYAVKHAGINRMTLHSYASTIMSILRRILLKSDNSTLFLWTYFPV